jgi:tetratricopeptide (TPR) repeat protein
MSDSVDHAKRQAFEPFLDRVDVLFDELSLAIRWDRPSILLAVYDSEFVRKDAESILSGRLSPLGQRILDFEVTKPDFDIPLALSRHPRHHKIVFFVSGLKWGGGKGGNNAYRALNIRRELFVDHKIRAVFWLHRPEAAALPRQAPDFWAFRHRVLEFSDPPAVGEIHGPSSRPARAGVDLQQMKVIAEVDADNPAAWNDLANAYKALGRFDEAITAYRKAVRLEDTYADAWRSLGEAYRGLRRDKEANHALRKAERLSRRTKN